MKLSNRLTLFLDGQFRFVDGTEMAQNLARTGLDIKVSNSFSMMPIGYAYVWNYRYGEQPVVVPNNEHRIFQQFTLKHKSNNLSFMHRLRTEERFLQTHHLDANNGWVDDGYGNNNQFRIRYRFSLTIPFTGEQNKGAEDHFYYLFIFDELFMSWGERVTYHEIDQNRVFVGVGYQFTKDVTIQFGPYYQLLVKANGLQQENNIGVGTWFIYNVDFTK